MKKHFQKILLFGVTLLQTSFIMAQTAELQVIHNAADPAAQKVDVYVNGNLILDNFEFRTATPFLPVPAGVALQIGIADSTSLTVNDTLVNFTVTLTANDRYIAVANGVLTPANFAVNPDGASTGFTLFLQNNIRNAAINPGDVDFVVVHGSSDAPTVDVLARNNGTLVDNATYSNITPYISVSASPYILDVTPGSNNSVIVASYLAPLTGLAGGSAVVFASGFLNPAVNQNGPAFGLFAALANGTVVPFQPISVAGLQVIHNAADPLADSVDIYIDGSLALDNFAFRTATPYLDLPAGVDINIGVAGKGSLTVNDTIKNFSVNLANGVNYVAIANGVLNTGSFSANPDGKNTAFTLFVNANTRFFAQAPPNIEFFGVHGSTDAPTVDILARNIATLVDDAAYGDITGYIPVPPADYILDVTPGNNNSTIVASFSADLTTLGGQSAVVFASGFLNPAVNQNGAAFGLFAALANGTVAEFPAFNSAKLQVIHNAADPSADTVDVYVNGNLLLDNFAFRTATPYVDVPAGVLLNVGVAAANSLTVNDTIKNFEFTLTNGQNYIAVANGVLTPGNFAVNPDGASTAFTLLVSNNMRLQSQAAGNVEFVAVHGATDAPTVDIVARNIATLADDASYTDITGYVSVAPGTYVIDITDASQSTIVATYKADLSLLADSTAVVFASGFLNPVNNQNGPAFGLFGALADGTVIEFPSVSVAYLQAIHNSADPAADSVDIWTLGNPALDNFKFRTATNFIEVPAGILLNIGVAPGNSTVISDTIRNFPVIFENGKNYLALASGVINPANFAVNPDGKSTAFNLLLVDYAKLSSTNPVDFDFIAVHGATDAPTVDVKVNSGGPILVDNAAFGDITPYVAVPATSYNLDVTPGNNNSIIVATYQADLTPLNGQSGVVFASGFLNPAVNQNGASFGLWVALKDGTTFPLPNVTGVDEVNQDENSFSLSPNPASDFVKITFGKNTNTRKQIKVSNALGQLVADFSPANGENTFAINTKTLDKGVYFVSVTDGNQVTVQKLLVD